MSRWWLLIVLVMANISSSAAETRRVQIAVLGLFHPNRIEVEVPASMPVSLSTGAQVVPLHTGSPNRIVFSRSRQRVVAEFAGRRIEGARLALRSDEKDCDVYVSVPGKLRRHYHGALEVAATDTELIIVVNMDLEVAVASVVAAEMTSEAAMEALKAQAVATRSFLVKGGRRHATADFCDTTHCQFLREPPAAQSAAWSAAHATRGEVLSWKGEVFAAMYSASCGGRTHSLAESGSPAQDYPYFSVPCDFCRRTPDKWSTRLRQQDADGLRTESEESRIHSARKLGWQALPSSQYARTPQADGSVLLDGEGRGHGIGLCQRGAAGMALAGNDYRRILAHYFPNASVRSLRATD